MNIRITEIIFIVIVLLEIIVPVRANVLAKSNNDYNNLSVAVTLNKPEDFNFQSKAEILNKRIKYLQQSRGLLVDTYHPDQSVFENIVDGKAWWGMYGSYIWGPGKRSIDGAAEESRFILNPLLLVAANPYTALIWKKGSISATDLKDTNFPLTWLPRSLSYFPGMSLAQVTYPVSEFDQQIKIRQNKLHCDPAKLQTHLFGLIAYNARDFGFQYLYLDLVKSINIVNTYGCNDATYIQQLIHCGNSSKYPGGCNNMSPAMAEIDRFAITNLPARACIYLWKNKPSSPTAVPDFTFYLDFR